MLTQILIETIQLLIVGLGAPLLVGLVRRVKARLQGRRGAGLLQPYADLRKLLAKEAVVSETTSWIFRFTPYLLAATMLLSALLVPLLTTRTPLGFLGNIIVLMYLFLLGTFFLALAGLDAGSAFGGMGSSREMAVAALAEPTVMIAIFAIALRAGNTGLDEIIRRGAADSLLLLTPGHLLAFMAFFIVAIAETGRLPVDNPATHLELTMIHEAMVLEYSGRHLMLIEWAAGMKLLIFLALLSNLFFPWGVALTVTPPALAVAFVALVAKVSVLAVGIAVLETAVAKLRLFRLPALLSGSFALALLAVISFLFVK
ncbi:MAG: formate hydrogenlyase [Candidatus Methylomirabilis oxygeniifera]|uniref:Similar to membrane-bound [NiFe]-hydrogenase-3, subunit D n=1 Tax=Methylomirabilis oxygeniifera TaxID=671143 RepID=D5ML60_METO1|nr:MAG: formate hydrogenlyase [Candidatus Methylomirabilis oxyfera]CBE69902.1 Similar to membrane-bound [NiFe]-hydrogenase-3, subunit D [Candidatus Methylomirabilis oxyfera]